MLSKLYIMHCLLTGKNVVLFNSEERIVGLTKSSKPSLKGHCSTSNLCTSHCNHLPPPNTHTPWEKVGH